MTMTYPELAELIFPDAKPIEYWFQKYPPRNNVNFVTRLAPSPTWFIHTWAIYMSLINHKLAKQSGWVFLLRIEDTDQKRFVEWATDLIINWLEEFWFEIKEWPKQWWEYWPYFQSQRKEIYHSFAKYLIAQWKAYPCWMTEEELDKIRQEQLKTKKVPWIYWNYSKWRNKTPDEYAEQLKKDNENFVIRFRSHWEIWKRIVFDDLNRWKISMLDNYNDNILIKKNRGLPTYHLAHVVDDTLMRMTHVIRWEERLTSVPWHLQLFDAFDIKPPIYCHLPSILKMENWKKRKLSKRKDPEAWIQYLFVQWYTTNAIIDYLLTLVDSKYEEWYLENIEWKLDNTKEITWHYHDWFKIKLEDLSSSWSLFDMTKLTRWNNKYLSKLTNEDLYNQALVWAKKYANTELDQWHWFILELLTKNPDLAKKWISIERFWPKDPKRFNTFFDIKDQIDFLYDDIWLSKLEKNYKEAKQKNETFIPNCITNELAWKFLDIYRQKLDLNVDQLTWFDQLKQIWFELWFARNNKEFKSGNFIWKIWDLAMFMRIMICWSKKTPDLFEVMKVLWKDKVFERLSKYEKFL